MIIKGNGAKQLFKIMTTFLIISVTLFYTSITAFASNYVGMNDTVYKGADYWGLEELPYGVDTGVVQFQYGSNYLTIYFDRLSIFDDYNTSELDTGTNHWWTYVNNHYWSCFFDNSSGEWDYLLNITSDSPIYYKKSYASGGFFNSQIGTVETVYLSVNGYVDGTFMNGAGGTQSHKVYSLTDYRLSQLAGDWTLSDSSAQRRIYSNCYQFKLSGAENNPYYVPCPAGGVTPTMTQGRQVGYYVEYYPSCEYLQNSSIREELKAQFEVLDGIWVDTSNILNELYNVNDYLDVISKNVDNVEFYLSSYYPRFLLGIQQIIALLEGPEYDSSSGIGSNTEFGDTAGGLMQDTVVPDVGTDSIVTNLGNSFLFIRNMFDRVTSEFNLVYVISFLLGLSFIAYVLGRVIKNKMNS